MPALRNRILGVTDGIAFCILAHDRPAALRRLVDRLAHPHATVFIHIDVKSRLSDFVAAITGTAANVHFVSDRQDVRWAGWSIVAAELAVARAALERGSYRSHVLLSNACFPCRSVAEIVDRLLSDSREHCDVHHPLYGHRLEHWAYRWNPPADWFPRGDGTVLRAMRYVLKTLGPMRVPPNGLRVFKGSMWWALGADALRHVVRTLDEDPALVRFFRYTFVPDEIVFPTLLTASSFRNRLAIDPVHRAPPPERGLRGLHYIEWAEWAPHPSTLTLESYPRIVASSALFVRKVTDPESTALIDRLCSE